MFQIVFLLSIYYFNLCNSFNDEAWIAYEREFQNANREELVIKSVRSEEHIHVKYNVWKWISKTLGAVCYSIGLMEKGLVLLSSTLSTDGSTFDITTNVLELLKEPSDAIIFTPKLNGSMEMAVVVTYQQEVQVDWLLIKEQKLEKWFNWISDGIVTHANIFRIENSYYIVVVTNKQSNVKLETYEIHIDLNKMKLVTSNNLPEITTSSAITKLKNNTYIAVPQTNLEEVIVYKFVNKTFTKNKAIKSPKVKTVISFQMNSRYYLAIDGYNSGIYEFTEDGFVRQNVVRGNMDGIHYWLPIPVDTYRDEVILLAERVLEHSTHNTYTAEIIVNNGGMFEEHEDIACTHDGEHVEWLTCLSHVAGIRGSSYIFVGGRLGLIVPQKNDNFSEIFMVDYEIVPMPHPKERELENLLLVREKLQKLIEIQRQEAKQLKESRAEMISRTVEIRSRQESVRRISHAKLFDLKSEVEEIGEKLSDIKDQLNNLHQNKSVYDTITIEDSAEFLGKIVAQNVLINSISLEPPRNLLEDIVNKKNISKITGKKTFTDLEINDLSFKKLNGIEAADIILSKELPTTITGNIILEQPLEVEKIQVLNGKINDNILIEDILSIQEHYNGELKFDNILVVDNFNVSIINGGTNDTAEKTEFKSKLELDSVFLPENATVGFVNGEDLEELISDMCLINVKCYIPRNLTIHGNITTKESYTDILNDLMFPEEFILLDSVPHMNITGKKVFKDNLSADEIMTGGTVCGVDTKKLITLSTDQDLPGKIAFENLALTEVLNVTNITGDDLDKFLSNPTLDNTDLVKANVILKKLIVEGDIIIRNDFNSENFNATLNNLVYKDEAEVEIPGEKHFPNGIEIENLFIDSDMINNVKIEDLVTKHEDENLFSISVLKGDVKIKRLFVHGTFDGFNISQLDESLVKLTGEQFIDSTLIFENELNVDKLHITEKLNDHQPEDYLYSTGDNEINWDVHLDIVHAENVTVEGAFSGHIDENNFTTILTHVLTYSGNQTVEVPIEIRLSEVEYLEADCVNGVDFEDVFTTGGLRKEWIEKLGNGMIDIENMTVTGSIQISEVDGRILDELLTKNPFKLDRFKDDLAIEGDVYFNELSIQKLSNVRWKKLMRMVVLKNDTNPKLNGTKTFTDTMKVEKLVETENINGILLDNILSKTGKQNLEGPITIDGNVVFEKLNIRKNLNQIPINFIPDRLNVSGNTYTITGDMVFQRLPYVQNLVTKGPINNKNFNELLDKIVYLDEDTVLKLPFNFFETVKIPGNITIKSINDEDFPDKLSKIVYVDRPAFINNEVIFVEPVFLDGSLQIYGDLTTTLLAGLDTDDWLRKAIFVDRGLLKGHFGFDNITIHESLTVGFVNDQDMNSVIDLKLTGTLENLKFEAIESVNDIPVGNLVNGHKLTDVVANTVMVDEKRKINANLVFRNNVLVRDNLLVKRINKKDASKLVNIKKDHTLISPFNFKEKCFFNSHVTIFGLLNGMNVSQWDRSLRSFSFDLQEVDTDWKVLQEVTFEDSLESEGTFEHFNVTDIMREIEERRLYKYQTEGGIIDTYNALCTDIKHMHRAAQQQIYKFRYFEDLQKISLPEKINNFFHFEFQKTQYLFINEDNCMSHVFVFKSTMFYPLIFKISTGPVEQVVPVSRGETKYLVTRGAIDVCLNGGTNIWEFKDDQLELKFKMDNMDLIQESLVPGTFYGLDSAGVIEYKIKNIGFHKFRHWKIFEDNTAFFPRGLSGTGLALRTGDKIIFLDRSDSANEEHEGFNVHSEVTLRGSMRHITNVVIPGRNGNDMAIIQVGTKRSKKTFVAVANHERTTVGGHADVIKIYDKPLQGGIFHEIRSYKPSSLVSIEFGQGETFLAFLEDKNILQIYEYKGIEGFKHRTSAKLPGTKLLPMTLPIDPYLNSRKALAVLNGNKITIIQAVMVGNRFEGDFDCGL